MCLTSTPTLRVAGALPVTPVTAIGLSTVALSLMAKSARLSKYFPGGGGVPAALRASVGPSPRHEMLDVVPVQRLSEGQAMSLAWAASLARICAGVMPGLALEMSAATPTTCGVAIEV